jgi:hypothetical protein
MATFAVVMLNPVVTVCGVVHRVWRDSEHFPLSCHRHFCRSFCRSFHRRLRYLFTIDDKNLPISKLTVLAAASVVDGGWICTNGVDSLACFLALRPLMAVASTEARFNRAAPSVVISRTFTEFRELLVMRVSFNCQHATVRKVDTAKFMAMPAAARNRFHACRVESGDDLVNAPVDALHTPPDWHRHLIRKGCAASWAVTARALVHLASA